MNAKSSPEFNLLIALCSREINQKAALSSGDNIDWNHFILLIKKHRLTFVTSNKVQELGINMPSSISLQLSEFNQNIKLKMLALVTEIKKLSQLFNHYKIDHIYLKGPVAAQQIYGDFTAKNSRDIDLLIKPNSIEESIHALENDGYQLIYPYHELNKAQKAYFNKVNNQLALFHPVKKIQLELHWRLFANQHTLKYDFSELNLGKEEIKIGEDKVYGLGEKHLLIYLCMHGAKHAWSKLYWLLEVTVLSKSSGNLSTTLEEAKKVGVERAVYQFIQLSWQLFGLEWDKVLVSQKSQQLIYLVDYARNLLIHPEKQGAKKLLENRKYKSSLRSGIKYQLGNKKLLSVNDFVILSLPSSLFLLYYPLRPFLLIWRLFQKSNA